MPRRVEHYHDHGPERSSFLAGLGLSTGCLFGVAAVMLAGVVGAVLLCAGCFFGIGEVSDRAKKSREEFEARQKEAEKTKATGKVRPQ